MKIQRQVEQFQIFAEEEPRELTGLGLSGSDEGRPHGNMTDDEEDAINSYYGDGHKFINGHLRGKEGYENVSHVRHIQHLDSLMDKTPEFTQPVHLHRGISNRFNSMNKVFGQPGEKVGKIYHEKGYTSATSDKDTAQGFAEGAGDEGAHIHIHAGSGTKALNEKYVTHDGNRDKAEDVVDREDEFTFPRGQRFKVQSDKIDWYNSDSYGQPVRHIHLKALPPHEETNLEHFSRYRKE